MRFGDFVAKFKKGKGGQIKSEIGTDEMELLVGEALLKSSKLRKFILDTRFDK
jgi:hypothetical protein